MELYKNPVVPNFFRFPAQEVEIAETKITDNMLYKDVKPILAAKEEVLKLFPIAAVYHIYKTMGTNLTENIGYWRSHEVQLCDSDSLDGDIIVREYQHSEHGAPRQIGELTIDKALLLRLYR